MLFDVMNRLILGSTVLSSLLLLIALIPQYIKSEDFEMSTNFATSGAINQMFVDGDELGKTLSQGINEDGHSSEFYPEAKRKPSDSSQAKTPESSLSTGYVENESTRESPVAIWPPGEDSQVINDRGKNDFGDKPESSEVGHQFISVLNNQSSVVFNDPGSSRADSHRSEVYGVKVQQLEQVDSSSSNYRDKPDKSQAQRTPDSSVTFIDQQDNSITNSLMTNSSHDGLGEYENQERKTSLRGRDLIAPKRNRKKTKKRTKLDDSMSSEQRNSSQIKDIQSSMISYSLVTTDRPLETLKFVNFVPASNQDNFSPEQDLRPENEFSRLSSPHNIEASTIIHNDNTSPSQLNTESRHLSTDITEKQQVIRIKPRIVSFDGRETDTIDTATSSARLTLDAAPTSVRPIIAASRDPDEDDGPDDDDNDQDSMDGDGPTLKSDKHPQAPVKGRATSRNTTASYSNSSFTDSPTSGNESPSSSLRSQPYRQVDQDDKISGLSEPKVSSNHSEASNQMKIENQANRVDDKQTKGRYSNQPNHELLVGPFKSEVDAPNILTIAGVVYRKSGSSSSLVKASKQVKSANEAENLPQLDSNQSRNQNQVLIMTNLPSGQSILTSPTMGTINSPIFNLRAQASQPIQQVDVANHGEQFVSGSNGALISLKPFDELQKGSAILVKDSNTSTKASLLRLYPSLGILENPSTINMIGTNGRLRQISVPMAASSSTSQLTTSGNQNFKYGVGTTNQSRRHPNKAANLKEGFLSDSIDGIRPLTSNSESSGTSIAIGSSISSILDGSPGFLASDLSGYINDLSPGTSIWTADQKGELQYQGSSLSPSASESQHDSKHIKEKAPIYIVQKDVKPVKYHLLRAYLKLRRLLRPFEATYVFPHESSSFVRRHQSPSGRPTTRRVKLGGKSRDVGRMKSFARL